VAAPTFITSDNVASYFSASLSKSLTVTTQVGDLVAVWAGSDTLPSTATSVPLNPPSGNGITFREIRAFVSDSFASAYMWYGIDNTGGTNWTLTVTSTSSTAVWGWGYAIFRGAGGLGASVLGYDATNIVPAVPLTTSAANSAILTFNIDWSAVDGSGRVWRTINGTTPTSGNGLELTYDVSTAIVVYAAYYPDVGAAGTYTTGLSAPTGQTYALISAEVLGPVVPTVTTAAITNVGPTSASGGGTVSLAGGSSITERGVCWNTSANPTIANSKATAAGTLGPFSASLTGLTDNTLYHVRAYATNAIGTGYGADITFQDYPVSSAWHRV
jgi:hypothetical protein